MRNLTSKPNAFANNLIIFLACQDDWQCKPDAFAIGIHHCALLHAGTIFTNLTGKRAISVTNELGVHHR